MYIWAAKFVIMNCFLNICAVGLFMTSIPSIAQDSTIDSRIRYYEKKIKLYLDKDNGLSPFYTINKEGVRIFASGHDKSAGKPEFRISWNNVESFRRYLKECDADDAMKMYKSGSFESIVYCATAQSDSAQKNKTGMFAGYRIAIDAGHTAGDIQTGIIEKKIPEV